MATSHSALYYTTHCCSAPRKKTYHLYYGKKNQTQKGFFQSLIVLVVGELNT